MAGVVARPMAEAARPAPQPALRHLLWLKWTLTRRGLARDRQRLIGAILFLLLLLPFSVGLGVVTYVLYVNLPRSAAAELLYVMLAGLFAGWLVVPIFLYGLNESVDVSRLLLYPIAAPRLMAGLLLSSLLDLPVLFLLALFAAVVAGWAVAPAAAVIVPLALLVLYGQMVAASQALLSLLNAVLRSRRFRDVSFVLLGALGSSFFLWQQLALRQLGVSGFRARQLLQVHVSPWLQWTPPGAVAHAIERAAAGDVTAALGWLAVSVAVLVVLAAAWHWALVRVMTGAETGGGRRAAAVAPAVARRPGPRLPLPRPVLALAGKDLRYFWRDPQLKAIILNTLLALGVLLVAPWFGLRRAPTLAQGGWLVLGLPLPVIVTTLALSFNALGMERGGLRALFLLPVAPARLLLGKNLAVAVVAALEAALVGTLLAAFSGGWALLPAALASTVAGVLVTLGVGNVVAVLLPARMPDGLRATYSADAGCARGLLQLAAFLVVWVLIAPIGAATGLPAFFGQPALHLIALPLALIYAGTIYILAVRLISPVLLQREPEILAITTRD